MIKLIKSTFYNEDLTKKQLCDYIMSAKQLSMSAQTHDFEHKFSKWQGRKYAVSFNSGSSANLALIQSLINLGYLAKGDKVAFSAITWATNVMPLIQLDLLPVPVDVELSSLNVSLEKFKEISEKHKLKALFITNLLGYCHDLEAIAAYCEEKNILLLEDNCEALGSVRKGVKLGNFGLASTFSFFVGHHMSTIEGGMVCTDDESLKDMLVMIRAHGWDRNLDPGRQSKIRKENDIDDFYAKYTFYELGYNLRLTDIQGFLGINQLDYIDEIIDRRQENFKKLSRIYDNEDFFDLSINMDKISSFAIPVICKTKEIQNKYINLCQDNEIEVRPIVGGLITEQPFFKKLSAASGVDMPNAQLIHNNGFYFGNNPEMTEEEIEFILEKFLCLKKCWLPAAADLSAGI